MTRPNRRPFLLVPLALALGSLASALQEQGPPDPDRRGAELDVDPEYVDLQEEVAHIPFTISGPRPIPIVEAMVNGEGPFQFYFDTGASVCVLDSGFVAELGIPVLGPTEIGDHTANARIAAERVKMESLELEGIRFEGLPAVAFDRSRFSRGTKIRGVLGLPLFRDHLLTVDYGAGRLTISEETLPEEGAGILPYGGELLPEIQIAVGDEEISCHIDSGSPGGFMFPTAFVESLPHKSAPKLLGMARTVNSEFEIWSVQLDATIVLAGLEFVDPEVGYNEILPNGVFGYQILKDLELSIDQRSRRVRFLPARTEEAGEDAGASTERIVDGRRAGRRPLGVGLALRGTQLSVSQVVEGSTAESAGIRVGDVLVRIDGELASQERLGQALEGEAAIRLELERDGEPLAVVLFGDQSYRIDVCG